LAGILLAIASAFVLHSYWALIIGILSQRILRVVFSYRMHPFRPRLSLAEWRRLTGYSFWSWVISVIGLLRERSDAILIGRMLNTTSVGVYSVGAEIAALPTTELVEPLCRAAFSAFAAERHDKTSPAESYLRIIAAMAALTLPAGVGISLVAGPLVRLAFGAQWSDAVLPMQILAIAGTVSVFGHVGSTLFYAHGKLRHSFGINLAALALRVVLLVLLIPGFGVAGAAAGVAIAVVLEQGAFVGVTIRHFDLGVHDVIRAIWRSLAATIAMAAALVATGLGWQPAGAAPPIPALLEGIALGAATYAAALLLLWLAAGRPAGAETDLLGMMKRVLRHVPTRRVSGS
jgi:O-antigen/teichoic acid export membrane protein